MIQHSTQVINNSVLRDLTYGRQIGEITDKFLSMKMENDLGVPRPLVTKSPDISDIYINLIGNGVINENDFGIKKTDVTKPRRLVVQIAPSVCLSVERERGILNAKVNDNMFEIIGLRGHSAENIAMWIIRQKQNYVHYMDEWQTVLKKVSKRLKGNHMAMLAAKAIFSEAVKDYPQLHYEFIEQKKRLRIKVKLPNSRLGVIIDAWWGSYKQQLPKQIEDLKVLVEAHKNNTINDFFISKR